MTERPFTPATLAEYLGCGRDTIYRAIEAKQLRAFRLGGKLLRITRRL